MRVRPSYANVASTLALVVALSGTAYAAATITGADVKNNTLTSKDVRSLSMKDFKPRMVPIGPGARMEASGGSLTVPNGPDNTFEMDTEAYDTGGMYTA